MFGASWSFSAKVTRHIFKMKNVIIYMFIVYAQRLQTSMIN